MKRLATATSLFLMITMFLWGGSLSASWAGETVEQATNDPLLQKLAATPFTHAVNPRTGKLRFLAGSHGASFATEGAPALTAAGPEASARKFLDTYGPLFGVAKQAEELTVKRITSPDATRSFVKFQQQCSGLKVFAAELVVQLDAQKRVRSVIGSVAPDCAVDTKPTVTEEEARKIGIGLAAEAHGVDPARLTAEGIALAVYNPALIGVGENKNILVWRMEVTAGGRATVREVVLVDARTGSVAHHFNRIYDARNRIVYDKNNDIASQDLPGTEDERKRWDGWVGDPTTLSDDVNNAYDFAGDTYDFYMTYHNRDSIDGNGMDLVNTVRFCPEGEDCPFQNAFWDPSYAQMIYGSGFAADDVVGHELTHGVTEYASGLIYDYQSGAINESLSDLWGELIDQANGKGDDSEGAKWLIGEDVAGIGPFRNMKDPTQFSDPDRMTSDNYWCWPMDNGGVHINSGINNKAVYLMTDGDTFNGKTVTGIGFEKVAKIYYEAQTNILTTNSQYADLYNALNLACDNLTGTVTTAADCQQVKNALDAVEMDQPPPCSDTPLPNLVAYRPPEWSDAIIVARSMGATGDSPSLTAADDLFVGWAITNDGYADIGDAFLTALYVDGSLVDAWASLPPVTPADWLWVHDYPIGKLSAGTHTISITTDVDDNIPESDETDNTYSRTITILPLRYNISGTVRAGSTGGAILSGAAVTLKNSSATINTTTTSSTSGTFTMLNVPEGSYTLTVSKSGYQTYTKTGYVVSGDQTNVIFVLAPNTYTVSGTVRSGSTTGAVLSGAVVSMGGKSATTNTYGAFTITGLAAGSYTVTVVKSGYLTYTRTNYAVSGNQSGLIFPITPVYTVSGTVRSGSTTGAVLAGAVVSLAGKSATTNAYGAFSFTGVPAGSYTLTAAKSGYLTYTKAYPVTTNQSIVVPLTAVYTVSGTVRSGTTTGAVVAGAAVSLAGKSATTNAYGAFSIAGIPAGSYTLAVSKTGFATYTKPYVVAGNQSVIVPLTPVYTWSGTVRSGTTTGAVVAGAVVAIGGKTATTNTYGAFTIAGIPAGSNTLTITKSGFQTYAKIYSVAANQSGLAFALTPLFNMSGTVRRGSSTGAVVAGATVSIAGKTAVTGTYGTFSITGIPAGTYPLAISKTGYKTYLNSAYPVRSNLTGLTFALSPL